MNKTYIKLWVRGSFIFLVCFLSLFLGCNRKETIRIGAIISTESPSGPSQEGIEVVEGLNMAVKEINGRGGINGRKLELIHENPALDAKKAKEIFLRIEASQKPLFYVSTLSFMSLALAPLAEQNSVVLVCTAASTPELTRNRQWVYRFWPTAEREVPTLLALLRKLKIEQLGVLYLNDDYGKSIIEELEKGFAGTGGRIRKIAFELAETDYYKQVASLLDSQAVYFVGFPTHLLAIARELEKQGYTGLKIAPNGAAIPSVRTDPALEGVYVITPIVYNPNYVFAQEFRHKYEEHYHKPLSHYAPCGYDLLMLLADLLEDRDLDRAAVKQVLDEGFRYSGVLENLQVKPGEHDISFPFFPARIVDGELIYQ
jgi:branched-chain amino acid transport system substrate-binding protein